MLFEGLWNSIWSEQNYNEGGTVEKDRTPVEKEDLIIESPVEEEPIINNDVIKEQPKVSSENRYDNDVRALVDAFGPLQKGSTIETNLQQILDICPRNRRRCDAYQGLISYLRKEHDVNLKITSNKAK